MSSSTATALRSSAVGCTEGELEVLEHFSYDWVIKGFRFLPQEPGERIFSPIFSTNNGVEWKLGMFPRGFNSNQDHVPIYLYLHSHKSETINVGVYVDISILSIKFKTTFYATYQTIDQFGPGCSIKRSELSNHDALAIHMEMKIPLKTISESVNTTQSMEQSFDFQGGQLIQDFRQLFKEPKFSDIDVIVGTHKFPAHKLVLTTRSPVFAAMFEHKETEENLTNEVKIENMEPEVVKAMLEFCYTDEVTNLEELAYGLLGAADKYDLQRLRNMCEKILYKTVNKENAAKILIHADLYRSYKLKEYVMTFMDDHLFDVMGTDGYKEMAGKYPTLVNDVMLTIAKRKKAKQ